MMELTGFSFENYRAFARRQSIALRPLTVLIGRNSAGKSAIARLPLLLARALSDRALAPIDLEVEGVDFGASLVDLIHNRIPHGAIGLGATFEGDKGERIDIWARVQHVSEYMLQVVSEFELKSTALAHFRVKWIETNPLDEMGRYRVDWNPSEIDGPNEIEEEPLVRNEVLMSFRGLMPTRIADSPQGIGPASTHEIMMHDVDTARAPIRAAAERIGYLGPFREAPQRSYRLPGGLPQDVGISGIHAPALLGADYLRRRGVVLEKVSAWYKDHLGGWPLSISRQGDSFSIVLRRPDNPSVEVNLADAGTGLSQVLPLVVQRQFDAVTGKGGGVEIVEQPELHLHPGAHGDLADLYIEAAKQPHARFLLETHSENFVLRIRRRIAQGTLNSDRVALYWVDGDAARGSSEIRHIEILPNGEVSAWPTGVFSEDFDEVKAIRAAQRGRGA